MATTAIRGKDWVFNAFWAACGEPTSPKCSLNIPITFLFKNGRPFKNLCTDLNSGFIKRIILEDVVVDRMENENGLRGESFRQLRAVRQLLLEFADKSGYSTTSADCICCKVWYSCIIIYSMKDCCIGFLQRRTDGRVDNQQVWPSFAQRAVADASSVYSGTRPFIKHSNRKFFNYPSGWFCEVVRFRITNSH